MSPCWVPARYKKVQNWRISGTEKKKATQDTKEQSKSPPKNPQQFTQDTSRTSDKELGKQIPWRLNKHM